MRKSQPKTSHHQGQGLQFILGLRICLQNLIFMANYVIKAQPKAVLQEVGMENSLAEQSSCILSLPMRPQHLTFIPNHLIKAHSKANIIPYEIKTRKPVTETSCPLHHQGQGQPFILRLTMRNRLTKAHFKANINSRKERMRKPQI
mmetsp:Transcript_24639/g.38887  ORF Transcript_24639/g.38887 Transcript_24639/m.38887 type:complete len:146 (+) Transcript_24639:313-750(+)